MNVIEFLIEFLFSPVGFVLLCSVAMYMAYYGGKLLKSSMPEFVIMCITGIAMLMLGTRCFLVGDNTSGITGLMLAIYFIFFSKKAWETMAEEERVRENQSQHNNLPMENTPAEVFIIEPPLEQGEDGKYYEQGDNVN